MNKPAISDWLLACVNIFFVWSLGGIASSYAGQIMGMNSIVFVCTMFLTCSLVLLVYTGPCKNTLAILFSKDTIIYGFSLIASFILGFGLYALITPVEVMLLQMLTTVLGMAVSFYLFKRIPSKTQFLGALIVLIGVLYVLFNIDEGKFVAVTLLLISTCIFQTIRSIMGEKHKDFNLAAKTSKTPIKDQLRIIGFIMFTLSIMFIAITLPLSILQTKLNFEIHSAIPILSDFLYFNGLLFGVFIGVILIVPERFIEFNSLTKLKTENYLALGAFAPFAAIFWQEVTKDLTGLDLSGFTFNDFIASCVIVVGGLLIVVGSFKKSK